MKLHLVRDEGIIGDRAFALARQPGLFDPDVRRTTNKNNFLMLMRDQALAALETSVDHRSKILTVKHYGKLLLQQPLNCETGRSVISKFFKHYLDDSSLSPTVVRFPGYKFTDLCARSSDKMRAISLINLNSIKALQKAMGKHIDARRFRGNIYFSNVPAFREFDWIDKIISIGSSEAKVTMRTKRCAATQVNPETAERDIDIPKELRKYFGHSNMGIYAELTVTGVASVGDPIG